MKIKICGLMENKDIDLANTYKPDYIGFIFYPPSHRYISYETASRFKKRLDNGIKAVGVFVDVPVDEIFNAYRMGAFDLVQLHGKESPETVKVLQESGIPVIKAVKIRSEDSLLNLKGYNPDFFLFDVYEKGKAGGTGERFNWDLLKDYTGDIPYFLAGGINIDNIDEGATRS